MAFAASLCDSIRPDLLPAILRHPFLRGLTDGTLPEACFRYYVVQDALYLHDFARGLARLAARAPDDDALLLLADHARNTVLVERALHAGFLAGWGLAAADVRATPPAPATLLYTQHLRVHAAESPWLVALAAFLPCYWIYAEVGTVLAEASSPHPLYRRWIETYAGDAFQTVARDVLATADRAAGAGFTDGDCAAALAAFRHSSRCEWMFWDAAWHRQPWPV